MEKSVSLIIIIINVLSNDDKGVQMCGIFVFCRLKRKGLRICALTVKLAQGQQTPLLYEIRHYLTRHYLTTGKDVRDTIAHIRTGLICRGISTPALLLNKLLP